MTPDEAIPIARVLKFVDRNGDVILYEPGAAAQVFEINEAADEAARRWRADLDRRFRPRAPWCSARATPLLRHAVRHDVTLVSANERRAT